MAKLVCHGQKYTKGAIAKIERHRYKSEVHMRCMLIIVDYGIDCIFLTKESFQILHGRLKIFFLS